MVVERPERKPCCSSMRILLSIGYNFELIIFVNSLGIIDIFEIGRKLRTEERSPFLNIGEIRTDFQDLGMTPVVNDWLNKEWSGYANIKRHSNRSFEDKWSGLKQI